MNDTTGGVAFFYLHGFASGPSSAKAQFIKEKLESLHQQVYVPDLNQPNFARLTISSQLKIIDDQIKKLGQNKALVFIGSSHGGLLSVIKSKAAHNLVALILLAPGFGKFSRWIDLLSSGDVDKWRHRGSIPVYHYAYMSEIELDYGFVEDAKRYQTENINIAVPTLVFHGASDEIVPVEESKKFASSNREYVQLHILDDDHQLLFSLPSIWTESMKFLQRLSLLPASSLL